MKLNKNDIIKMQRNQSRVAELELGRINYKRVHKNKKAYTRKGVSSFSFIQKES